LKHSTHWLALLITAALLATLFVGVDLQPRVDRDFFFASDSPQFQEARRIDQLFPATKFLVVSAASTNIDTQDYFNRVARLTDRLSLIVGVTGVKSIASGPDGLDDARESPLWRRLLIADDGKATNLVVMIDTDDATQLIEDVEHVVERATADDFDTRISGVPYIVEMIRRNLVRDFKGFSLAAIAIFAVVISVIFRSTTIVVGSMAACLSAVMLTLIVQHALDMKIGLLTANLATIVFVLTQSHIVFMTGNWRLEASENQSGDVTAAALRRTLAASAWCMVTTLLGFASLMLVDAKPLRDLGVGGSIGTVCAMVCAYGLYPPFLRLAERPSEGGAKASLFDSLWKRTLRAPLLACIVIAIGLGAGLMHLNTDPSLLSYFADDQPLHEGLAYIDRNGGSSPLKIVIARQDGGLLNNSDAYEQMWRLQQALEQDRAVGAILSLPVLMAEADRSSLITILMRWEWLLEIMEKPEHDNIALSFVTQDRSRGLFLLRMREADRDKPRLEVVKRLERIVRSSGHEPAMVGGIYALQGRLAQLVSKSLVQGLAGLVALFAVIALIVSRSWRIAAAMTLSLSLVPLSILGIIGWLGVPLDVISAPAANVCIGMAVDAMIHLVVAVRRQAAGNPITWQTWIAARQAQWKSILRSAAIVAIGFAVFGLSTFPPTQRFGLAVVFGTMVAAAAALGPLVMLGGAAGCGGDD
jgi:predicted RND superfamily exporter protein